MTKIVLASLATIAAVVWSILTAFGNGMRSSPGKFRGVGTIAAAWLGVVVLWLWWCFQLKVLRD